MFINRWANPFLGSNHDRGRIPVEWVDFLSVLTFFPALAGPEAQPARPSQTDMLPPKRAPLGPGGQRGPSGLRALWAWGPGGPSGLSLPPTISPSGWIRKLLQPLFLLFDFFTYDTFFWKIHTGQTDRPIQFFFRPKRVEMSKLP